MLPTCRRDFSPRHSSAFPHGGHQSQHVIALVLLGGLRRSVAPLRPASMLSFRKIAIMGRARRWGVVIKVVIAEPVLGRLRIGISPLWDTVNSLVILNRGERAPWPYQAWCRAAATATATRRNAGVSLLEWFQYRGGPVSPVLTPNPPSAEP